MVTPNDLASDFLYVDNLELVTFRRRTTGDTWSDTPGVPALRFQTTTQLSSGAPETRITWHLHAAALSNTRPSKSDRIVDASGKTWIVDTVNQQTWIVRFRCECHLLVT